MNKKIRLTGKAYRGYTGFLGTVEFVDGVSVHPLDIYARDRIALSFDANEIDEDGNEERAGVAHRLVAASKAAAPVIKAAERQTEEEKEAELRADKLRANQAPADQIYTREELEALARKEGIAGLRHKVADKWGLKHRAIGTLIEMVLKAQEAFIAKKNGGVADPVVAKDAPPPENPVIPPPVKEAGEEVDPDDIGLPPAPVEKDESDEDDEVLPPIVGLAEALIKAEQDAAAEGEGASSEAQ